MSHKDLTGQRFGRLVVLDEAGKTKQGNVVWLCQYGGRCITVCAERLEFNIFYDWALANGHRDDLTEE